MKINPCPYCKTKLDEFNVITGSYNKCDCYWVKCPKCGVNTTDDYESKRKAVNAWNRGEVKPPMQEEYKRICVHCGGEIKLINKEYDIWQCKKCKFYY